MSTKSLLKNKSCHCTKCNHAGSHKPCKYFQEGNVCPFDEVGCKFQHNEANINDAEQDAEHDEIHISLDTQGKTQMP